MSGLQRGALFAAAWLVVLGLVLLLTCGCVVTPRAGELEGEGAVDYPRIVGITCIFAVCVLGELGAADVVRVRCVAARCEVSRP